MCTVLGRIYKILTWQGRAGFREATQLERISVHLVQLIFRPEYTKYSKNMKEDGKAEPCQRLEVNTSITWKGRFEEASLKQEFSAQAAHQKHLGAFKIQIQALLPNYQYFRTSGGRIQVPGFFFLLRQNAYNIKVILLKCTDNSVPSGIFMALCNHHLYPIPRHSQKDTSHPLAVPPPSLQPLNCFESHRFAYVGHLI